MLILTRKPGESLFIGESVKITVMEIKGNQIRIGIDAPKELRIYREEIYLQIMEENKMASDVSAATGLGPIAFAGGNEGSDEDPSKRKLGLGRLVAKPVSGLNTMKGAQDQALFHSNKTQDAKRSQEEGAIASLSGSNKHERVEHKQPEVLVRKKLKPSDKA